MHRLAQISYLSLIALFLNCNIATGEILRLTTSDGPPHMIRETDSGLDIDVTRAVLERMGYQLEISYMPLTRAQAEVRYKRADLTVPIFTGTVEGLHISAPAIQYRPTAFTLKSRQLSLQALPELRHYRVMTFQGATGYFGQQFVLATEQAPEYIEYHDMSRLPVLLAAARTDVVVLDYYIFYHYLSQAENAGEIGDYNAHELFPRVPAAVGFADRHLRDLFNQTLEEIRSDGSYQRILKQYTE